MTVVMLRLPLTSVLLVGLLLSSDGLQVLPLAIVAVTVAYVASARFAPPTAAATAAAPAGAPASPAAAPGQQAGAVDRGGEGDPRPGGVTPAG
jgi:hypothetical protein